jgi:hypothetical protein
LQSHWKIFYLHQLPFFSIALGVNSKTFDAKSISKKGGIVKIGATQKLALFNKQPILDEFEF